MVGDFGGIVSAFVSPTSTARVTFAPGTVIDFSAFVKRTIQGSITLSIASGRFDFGPTHLTLGLSNPRGGFSGLPAADPIMTSETLRTVTPEPASLILVGSGVVAVLRGRRHSRGFNR